MLVVCSVGYLYTEKYIDCLFVIYLNANKSKMTTPNQRQRMRIRDRNRIEEYRKEVVDVLKRSAFLFLGDERGLALSKYRSLYDIPPSHFDLGFSSVVIGSRCSFWIYSHSDRSQINSQYISLYKDNPTEHITQHLYKLVYFSFL